MTPDVEKRLQSGRWRVYAEGTRTVKRTTAPDSLAVFLCPLKGTSPANYGRVERRNKRPHRGNRPGAPLQALVETRLPATHWQLNLTKTVKEVIMTESNLRHIPAHHQNIARSAQSFPFNVRRARERISANLAFLSCACADQALTVDFVTDSPALGDELRAISAQIDQVADRLEQAGGRS
jgi:hypothetical protein